MTAQSAMTPDEAKSIVITETITWHPVTGPRMCMCGHTHRGRTPSNNRYLAPQWHLCDAECGCPYLRLPEGQ